MLFRSALLTWRLRQGRPRETRNQLHTRWRDPADDAECIAWARSLFAACKPFATGGVYVNFMPEEEKDRVASAYLGNGGRLAAIKAKYDPHNLFRMNQNIRPTP
jgi:FAD/FMN-containing dehydrogenase